MKSFHFSHTIEYEVEAEDEEDAIYQITDLIRRDWPEYIDNGNITVANIVKSK
jgi:hypothetical protein